VLPHPNNADICFAGATNGGVWRTLSCTSDFPDWTPLTDQQDSQSVGDMVFDDDDINTLLVGIGRLSSFSQRGGSALGLLLTDNAFDTNPKWTVLDNAAGPVNFRTRDILFDSVYKRGDLLLASAYSASPLSCSNVGIWRSTDGGTTFDNVLRGLGRALAKDPDDPNRFYAVVDFVNFCNTTLTHANGVYRSEDSGATWIRTSIPALPGGNLNNAKLSVSNSRVWSGIFNNGIIETISYSDDFGAAWSSMDEILTPNDDGTTDGLGPGSIGSIHFAMLAHPTNKNEIYVAGDRQDCNNPGCFPNYIGATGYTGRLFRGNASVAATTDTIPSPQWEHLTDSNAVAGIPEGGTAGGSGPHAFGRDMKMRADGSVLHGDGGGISIRTNPSDNSGDWFGVCGNLQAFEVHSVAYEPVLGNVLFGTHGTGTILGRSSLAPSSSSGIESFTSVSLADGNFCMIDYTSSSTHVLYYHAEQFARSMYQTALKKSTGEFESRTSLSFGSYRGDFQTVAAMNPADQTIMALALSSNSVLYDIAIITSTTLGLTMQIQTLPTRVRIQTMEWSNDGVYLYLINTRTELTRCTIVPTWQCILIGNIPGVGIPAIADRNSDHVHKIVVNPTNNQDLYILVATFNYENPRFLYYDGSRWTNAGSVQGNGAAMSMIDGNTLAVGTSMGLFVLGDSTGIFTPATLSTPLPRVPVLDMVYDATDDLLVVATLGRGIWFLHQARDILQEFASSSVSFSNVESPKGLQDVMFDMAHTKNRDFGSASLSLSSMVIPPLKQDFEGWPENTP